MNRSDHWQNLAGSALKVAPKCIGRVTAHARFDSNAGISVPSAESIKPPVLGSYESPIRPTALKVEELSARP